MEKKRKRRKKRKENERGIVSPVHEKLQLFQLLQPQNLKAFVLKYLP